MKVTKQLLKNQLFSNQRSQFGIKIIPLNRMKFQDIGFHEKVSKIYEDSYSKSKSSSKLMINGFSSLTVLINIFLFPKALPLFLMAQIYLTRNRLLLLKNRSTTVHKIYLVKNGYQIIVFTNDNSFTLINIKDILEIINISKEEFLFNTFDKKFKIDLKNEINELYSFKKIIFERYNIETQFSLKNYNRFTINKLPDFLKDQIKKKTINYKIPSPYSNSINSLKLFYRKSLLGQNYIYNKRYFHLFNREKQKDPLIKAKKKFKLDYYTNYKFERKFGIDIYHFMAKLNSSDEERANCLKLLEDSPTNGRNLSSYKKKLKLI